MSRKYGRSSAYDDDSYDDHDDDYYDYDDEEAAAPSFSSVSNPVRAKEASELGKALFSPLPPWKLKRTTLNVDTTRQQPALVSSTSSAQTTGVVPFKFDTPSPDDKVRISQSGTMVSSARVASKPAVKPVSKPVVSKPPVAAKNKDAASSVTSQQQQQKSKSSAVSLGSSTSVKDEHLESKPNRSLQGDETNHDRAEHAEAQVFEGVMHMTLDGDQKGQEKKAAQTSSNAQKQLDLDSYVPESWILEEIKADRKPLLHLIVIGHVDAGKSTLMGHILHLLGRVSQKDMHKNERESKQQGKGSFAYAWVLDEGSEERARGVTMTIAVAHFETPKLRVVLLDAPGHKDFVPNMISGAAQADAAVLVVDASLGAFEAGLSGDGQSGGQTREHAQLARSLGVEQLIVAVNKMDAVDYSQQRYKSIKGSLQPFLKQCGFKESAVRWIPVSAIDGQNLTAPSSTTSLTSWYTGPTLLQAIDSFEQPLRNTLKPLRLVVAELVKSRSLGQAAVSGKLESGALRTGSKVLVMPIGEIATVKCIEQEGTPLNVALAGDSIDVGLTGVDPAVLATGGVLCHPEYPVQVATRLEARVLVLGISIPILRGGQAVLHAHHARESVRIADLVAILDSKTGSVTKKKPRCLIANQSALIEVVPERSLCLEEYSRFKALGRIALRDGGKTLAVGIVTRILSRQ
ncbi:unnamed protein product [Calypogeia fissa]